MVIKSLRWKSRQFNRLVRYIAKEDGRGDRGETWTMYYNLRYSDDLEVIAKQFRDNDAYRRERRNGITVYHDILTIHKEDRASITPEMLWDLTQRYLELRAPNALAFAKPHFDKEHLHVHIAISGTEFRSSKTLRLDNQAFMRVRRDLELYQRDQYPQIEHSSVYIDSLERRREHQQERAADLVRECLNQARTEDHFLDLLRGHGVEPYERGGKMVGIIHHHKKHRFATLSKNHGLDLAVLREREKRRRELDRLYEEKERRRSKAKDRGRDR